MTLSVRQIHEKALPLTRKNKFDAGIDLYSVEDVYIPAWSQTIVETGWELTDMPLPGLSVEWVSAMQIWPKSGNDAKFCLHTGAGIVDFLYAGPILVLLKNQSDGVITIPYGKSVAQALIVPVWSGDVVVSSESRSTERGATGGILSALPKPPDTFTVGGSLGYAYQDKKND